MTANITEKKTSNKKFKLDTGKVLWILIAVAIVITAFFLLRPSTYDDPDTAEPIEIRSDDLIESFVNAPGPTKDQYIGEYVSVTGALHGFDRDYISIGPLDSEYSYHDDIIGRITDEQFDYVVDIFEEDKEVVVKGVIVTYTTMLGCQIRVDEITVK